MNFDKKLVNAFLEQIFPLKEKFTYNKKTTEETINYYNELLDKLRAVDKEVLIAYGLTKLVIIPSDTNFVIKIPFCGRCSYGEKGKIIYYNGAKATDTSDYCLAEYEKYLKLKELQLDRFVAETEFYKTIDNIRIFIQEKIIPLESDWGEEPYNVAASLNSQEKAEECLDEHNNFYIDIEWLSMCFEYYPEEKVKNFVAFCFYIDSDIVDDMHSENYGYRKNGTPAILDFSGYNG